MASHGCTLPLSWAASVGGAMHSCHVDDVHFVVSCRHSLWVRTSHAALSFDKPIYVGLSYLNLEPDEQQVDHSDRSLLEGATGSRAPSAMQCTRFHSIYLSCASACASASL
jgi:hypothetical protein